MADPFVAEIRIFPFDFAPAGWAFCDGQLMPMSQNTALSSLLGETYGGGDEDNFALPDLRGSAAMHPGQGPGLSMHWLGEPGGSDTISLLESEMPQHAHVMRGNTAELGDTNVPGPGATFAMSGGGTLYQSMGNAELAPEALEPGGGDEPHNNMQPYLALNFAIALQGVFPPRP